MILLLISAYFQCVLVSSEHEEKSRRNDNLTNTDVWLNSTPGIESIDQTHPQFFRTTPLGNETNSHNNPPTLSYPSSPFLNVSSINPLLKHQPIRSQSSVLRSLTNSSSENVTFKPIPTSPTPEGISSSSANVERSFLSGIGPGFGSDLLIYPAETPPIIFDPAVVEHAKEWLLVTESTTANGQIIPKLSKIFNYDYTTKVYALTIRRNEGIAQRHISERQLKENPFQTRPIIHQGSTLSTISERRSHKSATNTFWHNPPKHSEELVLHKTRHPQTPSTKQRLKPGLLLGKVTITAAKNTEDVEEYEKTNLRERESIMRMHKIPTEKMWYSDRTQGLLLQTESMEPTPGKQFLRHLINTAPTTLSGVTAPLRSTVTASTKQTTSEMAETFEEGTLVIFLIELMGLTATKEKKSVHDVVKHADQIIHGFHKSGQLLWLGQPLLDFTKKIAKFLKEMEIDIIQDQALHLHHILSQRRQMLSEDLNTILETAGSLYDDDEGGHLLKILNEFAAYPNVTLSGYWLCKSLINTFLRPYRRLADTHQRRQLVNAVNLALKKTLSSSGSNDTTALRSGGSRQSNVSPDETEHSTHKEPPIEAKRIPRKRKRKRHGRSHKRKRDRKQYRIHNLRPGYKRINIEGNREGNTGI